MIHRDDVSKSVVVPAYGDKYYLLDHENHIIQESDAVNIAIDSFLHLLNRNPSKVLSQQVASHVAAGRNFSIRMSYYSINGKDYMVPFFNNDMHQELKSELTTAVKNSNGSIRSGGLVTIYPLKRAIIPSDDGDVSHMSRRHVRTATDVLSLASAAGMLATAGFVNIYPPHVTPTKMEANMELLVRGKEHNRWITGTLEFHTCLGVGRKDRLDAIRWFTSIENQTFLKAQNNSPYFLAKLTEIHSLLDFFGMREDYIQAEVLAEHEHTVRSSLPEGDENRIKAIIPLEILLSNSVDKIRKLLVASDKLRSIMVSTTGCDNQTAEDEIGEAFDNGTKGILVPSISMAVAV
jgi:hypothetical protein